MTKKLLCLLHNYQNLDGSILSGLDEKLNGQRAFKKIRFPVCELIMFLMITN